MKNIKRYALPVLTATLLSLSLSGCVGALIGGAAVGTKSAVDRRTTGAQTDDNVMALRVEPPHAPTCAKTTKSKATRPN